MVSSEKFKAVALDLRMAAFLQLARQEQIHGSRRADQAQIRHREDEEAVSPEVAA